MLGGVLLKQMYIALNNQQVDTAIFLYGRFRERYSKNLSEISLLPIWVTLLKQFPFPTKPINDKAILLLEKIAHDIPKFEGIQRYLDNTPLSTFVAARGLEVLYKIKTLEQFLKIEEFHLTARHNDPGLLKIEYIKIFGNGFLDLDEWFKAFYDAIVHNHWKIATYIFENQPLGYCFKYMPVDLISFVELAPINMIQLTNRYQFYQHVLTYDVTYINNHASYIDHYIIKRLLFQWSSPQFNSRLLNQKQYCDLVNTLLQLLTIAFREDIFTITEFEQTAKVPILHFIIQNKNSLPLLNILLQNKNIIALKPDTYSADFFANINIYPERVKSLQFEERKNSYAALMPTHSAENLIELVAIIEASLNFQNYDITLRLLEEIKLSDINLELNFAPEILARVLKNGKWQLAQLLIDKYKIPINFTHMRFDNDLIEFNNGLVAWLEHYPEQEKVKPLLFSTRIRDSIDENIKKGEKYPYLQTVLLQQNYH